MPLVIRPAQHEENVKMTRLMRFPIRFTWLPGALLVGMAMTGAARSSSFNDIGSDADCIAHYHFRNVESDNAGANVAPNAFPTDPMEMKDMNRDNISANVDTGIAVANRHQPDAELDAMGNGHEGDLDMDGVMDKSDNCVDVANADQMDGDSDGIGDICDVDLDNDGVTNVSDNCPNTANPNQLDTNRNGIGDACDTPPDMDMDGIVDNNDNCKNVSNVDQADKDGDGMGDACDLDVDGDGVANVVDNCPNVANAEQTDKDKNGAGDACDTSPVTPGYAVANALRCTVTDDASQGSASDFQPLGIVAMMALVARYRRAARKARRR